MEGRGIALAVPKFSEVQPYDASRAGIAVGAGSASPGSSSNGSSSQGVSRYQRGSAPSLISATSSASARPSGAISAAGAAGGAGARQSVLSGTRVASSVDRGGSPL